MMSLSAFKGDMRIFFFFCNLEKGGTSRPVRRTTYLYSSLAEAMQFDIFKLAQTIPPPPIETSRILG